MRCITARSAAPARSAAVAASGSATAISISTPGRCAANSDSTGGTTEARALPNAASRTAPRATPWISPRTDSIATKPSSTARAWPSTRAPAGVGRRGRTPRSISDTPASRSNAASCCDAADWV